MKSANVFSNYKWQMRASFDKVKLIVSEYQRGDPFRGSVKENV